MKKQKKKKQPLWLQLLPKLLSPIFDKLEEKLL